MKKRRLFKIIMLAGFVIGTSAAFTSCKDYDGDGKWKEKVSSNASLIEALQSQVGDLQEAKELCDQRWETSKRQYAALEELANGKVDSATYNNRVKWLQGQITSNTNRIATLESKANASAAENSRLKTRIDSLKRVVAADKQDLANLTTQVNTNKSNITKLNNDVSALNTAVENDRQKLASLQSDVNSKVDTATYNSRVRWLQSQITKNTDSIASIKTQIAALNREDARLNDSISALRQDINTNTQNITGLTQRVQTNESDITIIQGQISSINDSIDAHRVRLDALTALINGKADTADVATLNSQLVVARKNIASLQRADSVLQAAIDAANDSINSVKSTLATLSGTVSENADSIAALRSRLASCINNCSQTALKVSALVNTVDSLGNQLNTQIGLVYDSINSVVAITNTLNNAVVALQDDVADLIKKAHRDSILTKHADSLATEANNLATSNLARIETLENNYTNLNDSVNSLGRILGTVEDLANANEEAIGELAERVEALETAVAKIENAIRLQVTSINVNGTYNPVYGYYAIPSGDVRSSVLAAYYGNLTSTVQFPTATQTFYTNPEAGRLSNNDLDIVGAVKEQIPAGTIVTGGGQAGNAGTMWLTLNPSNVDLAGKTFTLVNSRGEKSAMNLTPAESSNDLLHFGYTRAANANGFYQVTGTVTKDDVEALKPNLNMEDIKDEVKTLYRAWRDRSANGGIKVNFSELAGVIYSNITDIVPALALKTTWTDNNDSAHSVLSQYSVAATAVKPFSFGTMQGKTYTPLPIYTSYEDINVNIDTVRLNGVEAGNYTVTVENADGTTSTYTVDGLNELVDQINNSIIGTQSDINSQIKDIDSQIDKVERYTKVFKVYDRWANRVNGWFSRDGNNNINRSLQPVLFVGRGNGLAKLGNAKYGTVAVQTGTSLLATTYTFELLAPAYKKWIAVTNVWPNSNDAVANVNSAQKDNSDCVAALRDANSGENMNKVVFGTTRHVTLGTLKKDYVYEIAYSAVDYMGKVVVRKFYVRGK